MALRKTAATALLLAPAAILFGLALIWPLGTILLRSLNSKGRNALEDELFFGHYTAIFQDDLLWQVTLHSFSLALMATVCTLVLAFPAAYLISRMSKSLSSVMMILILTPFWVSIIVRLFAFTTILGQKGIINSGLDLIGIGPFPLLYNTFATVVGMIAYLLPYMVLVLVSAMSAIDGALLTAARTMGASERQAFRDIYFPQVRPALLGGSVLIFVMGLGFFLTPAILGGPRNLTIPIFIQQQVQSYQWGKAAAMGMVLLAISTFGYLVAMRLGGKGILAPAQQGSRGATAREPMRMTMTTWICAGVLILDLLLLLLPLVVVIPTAFSNSSIIQFPPVGFSLKWFEEVFTDPVWSNSFFKSVRVGLASAIVATLAGLALARVGTKASRGTVKTAIQVVAITPLIVPVVLLGIGILDTQGRIGLLGTDLGLVIAHSILCLPLTFLVLANGLSSVDQSIEQAAWTMGASPLRGFFSVVVPNIMPALIGAAVISFVTSWDEAVLSMFQTGLEKTLPVTIYSYLKSGITPAVSAVATLVSLPVLIGTLLFALRAWRRTSQSPKAV